MTEHTNLGPRSPRWRLVLGLVALVLLPCVLASWLSGWHFFSFPFGSFVLWVGVPVGLIALANLIGRGGDDEGLDP